jgi:hypothetical protein
MRTFQASGEATPHRGDLPLYITSCKDVEFNSNARAPYRPLNLAALGWDQKCQMQPHGTIIAAQPGWGWFRFQIATSAGHSYCLSATCAPCVGGVNASPAPLLTIKFVGRLKGQAKHSDLSTEIESAGLGRVSVTDQVRVLWRNTTWPEAVTPINRGDVPLYLYR